VSALALLQLSVSPPCNWPSWQCRANQAHEFFACLLMPLLALHCHASLSARIDVLHAAWVAVPSLLHHFYMFTSHLQVACSALREFSRGLAISLLPHSASYHTSTCSHHIFQVVRCIVKRDWTSQCMTCCMPPHVICNLCRWPAALRSAAGLQQQHRQHAPTTWAHGAAHWLRDTADACSSSSSNAASSSINNSSSSINSCSQLPAGVAAA
jgi:hypothetical protein